MNFEEKYRKYKIKYITLKSNLNISAHGGKEKEESYKLTPIFTKESNQEPEPESKQEPELEQNQEPEQILTKMEWNINPGQPRNLRNNTSVILSKKDGSKFILREGDYINYISKSGFEKNGNLIELNINNPLRSKSRLIGRQHGQIKSFIDENGNHVGNPVQVEVYRQNYDTGIFEKYPTHKIHRLDYVTLYKPNESWPEGAGP